MNLISRCCYLTRLTVVLAILLVVCQLPRVDGHSIEGSRTRWEYCAIVSAWGGTTRTNHYVGLVTIRYFGDPESHQEQVRIEGEAILTGTPVNSAIVEQIRLRALSKALAKLGRDGWEMIGELPYARNSSPDESETKALFFKRPLDAGANDSTTRPN